MSLERFLEAHGLKQKTLAEATGTSEATISRVVSSQQFPRKELLDSILAFCRSHDPAITYEQLFGEPSSAAPAEAESESIEAAS